MSSLRELQHLDYSEENIDDLIAWKSRGVFPSTVKKKELYERQYRDFVVERGKLIYEPKNFEVVRPSDHKKVLEDLYEDVLSAGKGQNNFYRWIASQYLGISKRESQAFLKSREDYQLTRDPHKTLKKPLLGNRPFQFFAMDLVDMNQYLSVRQNKQKRYILSIMDLFSGYSWFEAIKTKEPKEILRAFKEIIATCNGHYPVRIASDNGAEWMGEFDEYLQEHKIKHIFTKTYTPEPHIEAVNNQLRKIMRQIFVRENTLAWLPYLKGIQDAKNSQFNENHDATPAQIVARFMKDEPHDRTYLKKLKTDQVAKYKARFSEYKDNVLNVGDFVRVKLSAIQTGLRQKEKAGNKKLIVVKFSPDVYRIKEVKFPKQGRIGLPKYVIEDKDGRFVTKENREYAKLFNRNDLLKVGENQRDIISQKNANTLNRLNNPEDIMVDGELAKKNAEPVPTVARVRPVRAVVVKTINQYQTKEWREALIGKTFVMDEKKYVVVDVFYQNNKIFKGYICEVNTPANSSANKDLSEDDKYVALYEVLKNGRREKWFENDYENAITKLEAQDK